MSEIQKLSEANVDQACLQQTSQQCVLTVEARAEISSTALPRLVLLFRKHQVELTHLEFTRRPTGFYIIFSSDSPAQKIIRVCNEARRLEEFYSIGIMDKSANNLADNIVI